MLGVDVVVPTYQRAEALDRCLVGLSRQSRAPNRVLVVVRVGDDSSWSVVQRHAADVVSPEVVPVGLPGVVAAMSAGVAKSTGAIVAFTDDDAVPRPDWLERILAVFGDCGVGAVGGRDVIRGQDGPLTADVGRILRWGLVSGMHHLGAGPPRDVDVLKGVNMAFRCSALALPAPGMLRGSGAQVDFELLTCAWAQSRGWRVVYDPEILVDHEAAPRSGGDQRRRPSASAVSEAGFNSVVAAASRGRCALIRHAAHAIALGTTDRPGIGRALVGLARRETEVVRRAGPSLRGRIAGLKACFGDKGLRAGPTMIPASTLRAGGRPLPQVTVVGHDIGDHGGMERIHSELIRRLSVRYEFTVISASLAGDLRRIVDWRRVPVPRGPFIGKFVAFYLMGGWTLGRLKRGVVHTVGAIVPNRADVATVHYCHIAAKGLRSEEYSGLRKGYQQVVDVVARAAERWSYRSGRLRVLAVVSRELAAEAEHHFPELPVEVTPNGIDTSRFVPEACVRGQMRRALGVSEQCCIALFVGGDWPRKGLDLAVAAVADVAASDIDIVLWVVGVGDRSKFVELAKELSIQERVTFFGRRADVEKFYQSADLFVLPSAYETFSLACFEAAACGLPLVIPALTGAASLVGNNEGGVIVERRRESIADAIRTLASHPTRRVALGHVARQRAGRFDLSESAEAVAAVYDGLLGRI